MEKEIEEKLDAIYSSVEKTRKYFLATMIMTVAMIVLPLLGLVIVIPKIISSYMEILSI
ncbi:MAG: hypothetical protein PHV25_00720 [Candidatus Pacebacteria bacterium]|nr:hypothetical protein [Candidatus Paceibacterota bacterium]